MNQDETMQDIHRKIDRERALINAANAMRAQTDNEAVRSRLDSQIRDGRRAGVDLDAEELGGVMMQRLTELFEQETGGPRKLLIH